MGELGNETMTLIKYTPLSTMCYFLFVTSSIRRGPPWLYLQGSGWYLALYPSLASDTNKIAPIH